MRDVATPSDLLRPEDMLKSISQLFAPAEGASGKPVEQPADETSTAPGSEEGVGDGVAARVWAWVRVGTASWAWDVGRLRRGRAGEGDGAGEADED